MYSTSLREPGPPGQFPSQRAYALLVIGPSHSCRTIDFIMTAAASTFRAPWGTLDASACSSEHGDDCSPSGAWPVARSRPSRFVRLSANGSDSTAGICTLDRGCRRSGKLGVDTGVTECSMRTSAGSFCYLKTLQSLSIPTSWSTQRGRSFGPLYRLGSRFWVQLPAPRPHSPLSW